MSSLDARVRRLYNATMYEVTPGDWGLLAEDYLQILTTQGLDPESLRTEAERIEAIVTRTADPLDGEKARAELGDAIVNEPNAYSACMYFINRRYKEADLTIWMPRGEGSALLDHVIRLRKKDGRKAG